MVYFSVSDVRCVDGKISCTCAEESSSYFAEGASHACLFKGSEASSVATGMEHVAFFTTFSDEECTVPFAASDMAVNGSYPADILPDVAYPLGGCTPSSSSGNFVQVTSNANDGELVFAEYSDAACTAAARTTTKEVRVPAGCKRAHWLRGNVWTRVESFGEDLERMVSCRGVMTVGHYSSSECAPSSFVKADVYTSTKGECSDSSRGPYSTTVSTADGTSNAFEVGLGNTCSDLTTFETFQCTPQGGSSGMYTKALSSSYLRRRGLSPRWVSASLSRSSRAVFSTIAYGRQPASPFTDSDLTYASPILLKVEGADRSPTKGGKPFSMKGEQFGPADSGMLLQLVYGGKNHTVVPRPFPFMASSCLLDSTNPHTSMNCKTATGTGKGHSWKLLLGANSAESAILDANTRYESPVIESFFRPNFTLPEGSTEDPVKLYPTKGEEIIEIRGSNFGPVPLFFYHMFEVKGRSVAAALLGTGLPEELLNFVAKDCRNMPSNPHNVILCIVPSGVGRGVQWTMTIDEQDSVQPSTGYNKPIVHRVYPDNSLDRQQAEAVGNNIVNASTEGNEWVFIEGENFGAHIEYLTKVAYGCSGNPKQHELVPCVDEACTAGHCQLIIPHRKLRCRTIEGVGKNLVWRVTVAGQTTDASAAKAPTAPRLSYASPIIYRMERLSAALGASPTTGGTTKGVSESSKGYQMRIIGSDFGPNGNFALNFWGQRIPIDTVQRLSNPRRDVVTYTVPEGQGRWRPVYVTQKQQLLSNDKCEQGSENVFYSYLPPDTNRLKTGVSRFRIRR